MSALLSVYGMCFSAIPNSKRVKENSNLENLYFRTVGYKYSSLTVIMLLSVMYYRQLRSFSLYLICRLFCSRVFFSPHVSAVPHTIHMRPELSGGKLHGVKRCQHCMEIWVEKGGFQVSGEDKETEKLSVIFIFVKNIIIFSGSYLRGDN